MSYAKGDVVVIPFPFTDLSHSKKRPALILSSSKNLILCQITKKFDSQSIGLDQADFEQGSLPDCFIRPNMIFTAGQDIVLYKVGRLRKNKMDNVAGVVCSLFR